MINATWGLIPMTKQMRAQGRGHYFSKPFKTQDKTEEDKLNIRSLVTQIASIFPSESMVQVPWKHRTLWVFSTVSHLLKEIAFSFLLPLNQQKMPSFSKTVTKMCVWDMQNQTPEQMHKYQLWCYHQETLNTARKVSGKPGKLRGLSAEGIADNRASTDNSSPECAWWFSPSSALCTGWTSLSSISENEKCHTRPSVRIIFHTCNFYKQNY